MPTQRESNAQSHYVNAACEKIAGELFLDCWRHLPFGARAENAKQIRGNTDRNDPRAMDEHASLA
jgi:hypothetical protein